MLVFYLFKKSSSFLLIFLSYKLCFLPLSTKFSHMMNGLSAICLSYAKPLMSFLDETYHKKVCSLFSLFFIYIIVIIITSIICLSPSVFPCSLRFFCYTLFLIRNLFGRFIFFIFLLPCFHLPGEWGVCVHIYQRGSKHVK